MRWRCRRDTTGLRMKTMAPARISGGQMTLNTQATRPTRASTAASPTRAHATAPARRIRSPIEETLGGGRQVSGDHLLDAHQRLGPRPLVTEALDQRHDLHAGGDA